MPGHTTPDPPTCPARPLPLNLLPELPPQTPSLGPSPTLSQTPPWAPSLDPLPCCPCPTLTLDPSPQDPHSPDSSPLLPPWAPSPDLLPGTPSPQTLVPCYDPGPLPGPPSLKPHSPDPCPLPQPWTPYPDPYVPDPASSTAPSPVPSPEPPGTRVVSPARSKTQRLCKVRWTIGSSFFCWETGFLSSVQMKWDVVRPLPVCLRRPLRRVDLLRCFFNQLMAVK